MSLIFLDRNDLEDLLDLFAKGFNLIFTARTPRIRVVKEDHEDNKFIECAVVLKAQVIITGDKALAEVKEYMSIKIVSPRQLLKVPPPSSKGSITTG